MRVEAKGIIDRIDFDSVILGSSVLANTSAKEANQKIGNKWQNLTLWASTFKERSILLHYLFKHKQIKAIVYSLDIIYLINEQKTFAVEIDPMIYERYSFIKVFYKYYMSNLNFIKCAIKWSKKPKCVGEIEDLETVTSLSFFLDNIGGFEKWENEEKRKIAEQLKKTNGIKANVITNYKKQKNDIERYLLSFIRQYPQTSFHLLSPSHPRAMFLLPPKEYKTERTKEQYFNEWGIMLKWLVGECSKYENCKIYGFDDLPYADDIANYGDFVHPNVDMNSMQLDAIADGTHILTPKNIDEYLQTMENKIKAYDLTPLINEIKAWEAEQNATAKE